MLFKNSQPQIFNNRKSEKLGKIKEKTIAEEQGHTKEPTLKLNLNKLDEISSSISKTLITDRAFPRQKAKNHLLDKRWKHLLSRMKGHNKLCKNRCEQKKCNETQDFPVPQKKFLDDATIKSLQRLPVCNRSRSVMDQNSRQEPTQHKDKEPIKLVKMNTEKFTTISKLNKKFMSKIVANAGPRNTDRILMEFKPLPSFKIPKKKKINPTKSQKLYSEGSTLNFSTDPYMYPPRTRSKRKDFSKAYASMITYEKKKRFNSPKSKSLKSQKKRSQPRQGKKGLKLDKEKIQTWLDQK